jgi:hypothetical protein
MLVFRSNLQSNVGTKLSTFEYFCIVLMLLWTTDYEHPPSRTWYLELSLEGHQNCIIRPDQNPFTPPQQATFALDTKFAETTKSSRQISREFILLRGNSNFQNLGKGNLHLHGPLNDVVGLS